MSGHGTTISPITSDAPEILRIGPRWRICRGVTYGARSALAAGRLVRMGHDSLAVPPPVRGVGRLARAIGRLALTVERPVRTIGYLVRTGQAPPLPVRRQRPDDPL